MRPQEYVELLSRGTSPQEAPVVEGLCGRILRGRTDADFSNLSDDPSRLVVMLTDAEGLRGLLGKTGYDMLLLVGHHPQYIRTRVLEGTRYKLVVFSEREAILATWDNVLTLVAQIYPDLAPPCAAHGPVLRRLAFAEIEALAGYRFRDVDQPEAPRFMDHARLLASEQGVWELRAFLYHSLHLREQFSGDGYTYDADGRCCVREYLLRNQRLADLAGHALVDLDVRLPT